MSYKKALVLLAVPLALTLSGCATGFPAKVSRLQAMPSPGGESFIVEAADPGDRLKPEFSRYAALVRQHMVEQGYRPAASRADATLIVNVDYGVSEGRQHRTARDPVDFGRPDPSWSRFGYGLPDLMLYRSFLDLDIRRASTGQAVFEGVAQAQSSINALPVLVPNLVEAMFTDFPGKSGETMRITVRDELRR